MDLVLTLEQIDSDDRERVGGKSYALAAMVKNGMKVPEALCLKVEAYHHYLETTGLGARILMEFNRKDFAEVRWEEMWDAALRIRNLFINTPMPSDLRASLQGVLESKLSGESVVVRSSAPGEDSLHASFAGFGWFGLHSGRIERCFTGRNWAWMWKRVPWLWWFRSSSQVIAPGSLSVRIPMTLTKL
jgi:pyruvate,water dikinase